MSSEWTYTHTLVELASLATGDEAFAVWIPGHAGQAVFVRLAHLCAQLPRLQRDSELIGVIITNTPLYITISRNKVYGSGKLMLDTDMSPV